MLAACYWQRFWESKGPLWNASYQGMKDGCPPARHEERMLWYRRQRVYHLTRCSNGKLGCYCLTRQMLKGAGDALELCLACLPVTGATHRARRVEFSQQGLEQPLPRRALVSQIVGSGTCSSAGFAVCYLDMVSGQILARSSATHDFWDGV